MQGRFIYQPETIQNLMQDSAAFEAQRHRKVYEKITKAYNNLDFSFIDKLECSLKDMDDASNSLTVLKACEVEQDHLMQFLIFSTNKTAFKLYGFESYDVFLAYSGVESNCKLLRSTAGYPTLAIMLLEMSRIIHIKPLLSVCKAWNEGRFAAALKIPMDLNDKLVPEGYVLSASVALPTKVDIEMIAIQCCFNNKKVIAFLNNIIAAKRQITLSE